MEVPRKIPQDQAKRKVDCIKDALDNPEKLDAWLESVDEKSEVGRSKYGNSCPIHRYLLHSCGVFVSVGTSYASVYTTGSSGDQMVVIPDWARQFICRVDMQGVRSISCKRAKRIMEWLRNEGLIPQRQEAA